MGKSPLLLLQPTTGKIHVIRCRTTIDCPAVRAMKKPHLKQASQLLVPANMESNHREVQ